MQDAQYFSDSEHQMVSGSWAQYRGSLGGGGGGQPDMHRRMRNRTLTGLETMRMGMDGHGLRPGSAQGRPITPSFSNEKDPGQTFIDFNPAGKRHESIIPLFSLSVKFTFKIFALKIKTAFTSHFHQNW